MAEARTIELVEIDGVEVTILVENTTDNLSSTPPFVENELTRLQRRGADLVAGDRLCCAAHGLACLVTVQRGDRARTLLFDSGPDGEILATNVQRLGIDLGAVEAVVLSHGHWDHGGGMLRALDLVKVAGGPTGLPFFGHPDMFHQRASKRHDGTFRLLEDVPSTHALTMHGADPVITTEPALALDGQVFVSGEIPRVTSFETGLPGQHRRTSDQADWEPDELIADERFLAVHVRGQGLVVLSACSHAGLINVLTHVSEVFPDVPVHTIMGGLHLAGSNERRIPETIEHLVGFSPSTIAAGHCTGWRAIAALLEAFGDRRVVPLSVGKRFTIAAMPPA
jgi:7,8-dihydropterin-6-yl-methyl-4-(beta-D-ribofuranosyl)aminobenzene 5'-phosphate synthase